MFNMESVYDHFYRICNYNDVLTDIYMKAREVVLQIDPDVCDITPWVIKLVNVLYGDSLEEEIRKLPEYAHYFSQEEIDKIAGDPEMSGHNNSRLFNIVRPNQSIGSGPSTMDNWLQPYQDPNVLPSIYFDTSNIAAPSNGNDFQQSGEIVGSHLEIVQNYQFPNDLNASRFQPEMSFHNPQNSAHLNLNTTSGSPRPSFAENIRNEMRRTGNDISINYAGESNNPEQNLSQNQQNGDLDLTARDLSQVHQNSPEATQNDWNNNQNVIVLHNEPYIEDIALFRQLNGEENDKISELVEPDLSNSYETANNSDHIVVDLRGSDFDPIVVCTKPDGNCRKTGCKNNRRQSKKSLNSTFKCRTNATNNLNIDLPKPAPKRKYTRNVGKFKPKIDNRRPSMVSGQTSKLRQSKKLKVIANIVKKTINNNSHINNSRNVKKQQIRYSSNQTPSGRSNYNTSQRNSLTADSTKYPTRRRIPPETVVEPAKENVFFDDLRTKFLRNTATSNEITMWIIQDYLERASELLKVLESRIAIEVTKDYSDKGNVEQTMVRTYRPESNAITEKQLQLSKILWNKLGTLIQNEGGMRCKNKEPGKIKILQNIIIKQGHSDEDTNLSNDANIRDSSPMKTDKKGNQPTDSTFLSKPSTVKTNRIVIPSGNKRYHIRRNILKKESRFTDSGVKFQIERSTSNSDFITNTSTPICGLERVTIPDFHTHESSCKTECPSERPQSTIAKELFPENETIPATVKLLSDATDEEEQHNLTLSAGIPRVVEPSGNVARQLTSLTSEQIEFPVAMMAKIKTHMDNEEIDYEHFQIGLGGHNAQNRNNLIVFEDLELGNNEEIQQTPEQINTTLMIKQDDRFENEPTSIVDGRCAIDDFLLQINRDDGKNTNQIIVEKSLHSGQSVNLSFVAEQEKEIQENQNLLETIAQKTDFKSDGIVKNHHYKFKSEVRLIEYCISLADNIVKATFKDFQSSVYLCDKIVYNGMEKVSKSKLNWNKMEKDTKLGIPGVFTETAKLSDGCNEVSSSEIPPEIGKTLLNDETIKLQLDVCKMTQEDSTGASKDSHLKPIPSLKIKDTIESTPAENGIRNIDPVSANSYPGNTLLEMLYTVVNEEISRISLEEFNLSEKFNEAPTDENGIESPCTSAYSDESKMRRVQPDGVNQESVCSGAVVLGTITCLRNRSWNKIIGSDTFKNELSLLSNVDAEFIDGLATILHDQLNSTTVNSEDRVLDCEDSEMNMAEPSNLVPTDGPTEQISEESVVRLNKPLCTGDPSNIEVKASFLDTINQGICENPGQSRVVHEKPAMSEELSCLDFILSESRNEEDVETLLSGAICSENNTEKYLVDITRNTETELEGVFVMDIDGSDNIIYISDDSSHSEQNFQNGMNCGDVFSSTVLPIGRKPPFNTVNIETCSFSDGSTANAVSTCTESSSVSDGKDNLVIQSRNRVVGMDVETDMSTVSQETSAGSSDKRSSEESLNDRYQLDEHTVSVLKEKLGKILCKYEQKNEVLEEMKLEENGGPNVRRVPIRSRKRTEFYAPGDFRKIPDESTRKKPGLKSKKKINEESLTLEALYDEEKENSDVPGTWKEPTSTADGTEKRQLRKRKRGCSKSTTASPILASALKDRRLRTSVSQINKELRVELIRESFGETCEYPAKRLKLSED